MPSAGGGSSSIVFWICLFVGCTAIPMTLDLLRVFLPRRLLSGRLVEAWQRPLLLAMVACLCAWAYAAFFDVVRYSYAPFSAPWSAYLILITFLWLNTVWNYTLCASVDPGYAADATVTAAASGGSSDGGGSSGGVADGDAESFPSHNHDGCSSGGGSTHCHAHATRRSGGAGAFPDGTQLCRICDKRVLHFDHRARSSSASESRPLALASLTAPASSSDHF